MSSAEERTRATASRIVPVRKGMNGALVALFIWTKRVYARPLAHVEDEGTGCITRAHVHDMAAEPRTGSRRLSRTRPARNSDRGREWAYPEPSRHWGCAY